MKLYNENVLIKTVFALIDLFYKLLFPFFILFYVLPLLLNFPSFSNSNWNSVDIMGLFESQREFVLFKEIPLINKILVLMLNMGVVVIIYFCLKKLNRFIKNVFEGNPFSKENGLILKFVGTVVAISAAIIHLANGIMIVTSTISLRSEIVLILMRILYVLTVIFDPFVIIGLFVLVLGEVFIQGAIIKEENDLTV